jgi:PAS domain S-box-containing protein
MAAPPTPIKQRIRLVILWTSLTVLLLTSSGFVIYELVASRQELQRNVQLAAEMVASQLTSSLMYQNRSDAREVLSSLSNVEHILSAALYSTNGTLFAYYPTNTPAHLIPSQEPRFRREFTTSAFLWAEPVIQGEKRAGTLYLKSNLEPIYERLRLYSLIGALVAIISFLVAVVLSEQLQKSISQPILALARTAEIISEKRDYTVRAPEASADELGLLTGAFNHMLGQIQDRERALRENAERLRLALEAAQIGTWDWHIASNRLDWDQFVHRQLGLTPQQAPASLETLLQRVPREDQAWIKRAVREAMKPGREEFNKELRVVWPDGSTHYLVVRGKAIHDPSGCAVRMTGVSLEITERRKAEETQALLAAIVASSDDAIIGKNLQGLVISWNTGAQQMFGYTAAEMIGKPVTLITDPDHPEEEPRILDRIRAGSPVEHYETVRLRKDGSAVDVSLSISPIRGPGGQVLGASSIARDISERKRSEAVLREQAAALREQAQLLDLANVLVRDLEDRIFLWSAGMEQCYGWSRRETLNKISHELFRTEFPEPYEQIVAHLMKHGEWTGELVHRRRDGSRLIAASRWVLHRDEAGQPTAVLEVNNDITARKQAEEEIRRLNAELERRVQERTAELTEANKELEAFTYSVSHDLRAPLRHIDSFARILEEELPPQTASTVRGYTNRIRRGTQTMSRLVDDLLNLSRVSRADLGWQRVQLNPLVEEVIADLNPELGQRQIDFRVGALGEVDADPGLLNQVFANLLSNAAKYSRPVEKALIEVGKLSTPDPNTFYVRDNGVGFDMKYINKLFGVFERLHPSEQFEGTGIGLATVRRIIQKHGGKVWAEAAPGKGATFYFTLPSPATRSDELPADTNPARNH